MALLANPPLWAATCHHGNCVKDGERELIEEFARKMGGHDEIWYATNIEIVDYLAAAKGLIVSANGRLIENPRALPVWIEFQGRAVQLLPGKVTQLDGGASNSDIR